MTIIQFISAFGLGAIVTAFVQAWLSQRLDKVKRDFQEKKEAYVGFLQSIHKSEIERTDEASLYTGHWIARIELVGSTLVIAACHKYMNTNPMNGECHPDRPQVMKELKEAMRKDLGVQSK